MDHDLYNLFFHFWWLIFPLFWMCMMVAAHWSRHTRANRALDILKTYVDQGKDPPPELLKALQAQSAMPGDRDWDRRYWRRAPEARLIRALLFLSLACGFGFLTYVSPNQNWHHQFGLLIPAMVFAALALGNFLSLFLWRRELPLYDRDGKNQ